MFVHINKIIEHARAWLATEGHVADSTISKAVESVVAHIAEKAQEEFAVELLQHKGYTVSAPMSTQPSTT